MMLKSLTFQFVLISPSFFQYKMICLSIAQSFMLAYLLYVSFEAPSVNLIKLFISKSEAAEAKAKSLQRQSKLAAEVRHLLASCNGKGDLNNNNSNGSILKGDFTTTTTTTAEEKKVN